MRRRLAVIVAVLLALGAWTAIAEHVEATVPPCGELTLLYAGGVPRGGDAWCAGHISWSVKVGCSATRYGSIYGYVYGPWNSRWESVAYCPSHYPYARWVAARVYG